jgi:hypothetical protein
LSNANTALSSASQLGGVSIISVDKIAIYTSDNNQNQTNINPDGNTPNKDSNSLAIILGVIIPSVVIIALIIVGCILKKKRD